MIKPRKLEHFEDQLKVSPLGRRVLELLKFHAREVMYLINHNRPTMVCWQRNNGPKFIKSFVDSGFDEGAEFEKEINGVKMEEILLAMAEVLQDNGSVELKQTIGKYAAPALRIAKESSSLQEILHKIVNTQIIEYHD